MRRPAVVLSFAPASIVATLISSFVPAPARALDPTRAITQYVHRAWRTDDGLPQTSATSIAQTHDGYLWIGTREGLARFDGVRYERAGHGIFHARKLPLAGNVMAIANCGGAVWVGMHAGLVQIVGETTRAFTTADGLPNDEVLSLATVDRTLWIGTVNGVARWNDGVFRSDVPRKLRNAEVWAILADSDQTLWFGTRHGLMRMRGAKLDVLTAGSGLSNEYISALFEDRERSLWVGTNLGGVNQLRDGAVTTFSMN